MEAANRFLKELRSNKQSLGAWQMFPSASTSRTIARVPGISWVLIDQEHGNVGDSAMHECIANISPYGVSPLVRIPDSERWMIKRALDAGAHGIMIPLLSTVEEVEEIVKQPSSFKLKPSPLTKTSKQLLKSPALGHPLAHGVEHTVLTEAIQHILNVSHAAGKKAGIFTTSGEDARKRVEQGFDMVHIGTDVHILIGGVTAGLAEAKGGTSKAKKGGY